MVGHVISAEVTLSRRDEMGFRLLVGREALRQGYLVDPRRSYLAAATSPLLPRPARGSLAGRIAHRCAMPARERGASVLLHKAGENLRFDDYAGAVGVRRVLAAFGMTEPPSDDDHEP